MSFLDAQKLHFKVRKTLHLTLQYNVFFQLFFFLMAPNVLALATTLETLPKKLISCPEYTERKTERPLKDGKNKVYGIYFCH